MAQVKIRPIFATVLLLQGLLFSPCASGNEDADKIVLVSTTTAIYISRGPEFDFSPLPIDVGRPEGIDFDTEINMLFWTDSTARAIKRADLDGSDWTFVTSAGQNADEIAVDGNEDLIFWANAAFRDGAITRVNYDGKDRRQIVAQSSGVYSITLDKTNRTIYWTVGGTLKSSSYEGHNQKTLAHVSGAGYMYGVAINAQASKVYWCEGSLLMSLALTQTERSKRMVTFTSETCRGAAWFGGIYWIQRSTLTVRDGLTYRVRDSPVTQSSVTMTDVYAGWKKIPVLDGGECDFERIQCHWTFRNSMPNNLTWTRWSVELARNNSIGPTLDHTTKGTSGHYMLLNPDTELISPGDTITFFSPLISTSLTETKCFKFWYYMHDVTNGSLNVGFKHDETDSRSSIHSSDELHPRWSSYGSHPNEWVGAEIELRDAGVGRILVKAVVGDPSSNTIAIDDVQYGECHQDSRLVCEDSSMTVYLDKARLGISSQDDVSFKNSRCRGVEYDVDTVAITTPYNRCGTTVSESDDVILFSNQVNVAVRSGIRSSNVSIRVNCSFSRAYHVGMTYLGHAWIKHISEDGYGNFSVGIRQYSSASFEDAFSSDMFPQQIEVNDYIFMATEMVTIADLVDTLHNERCWATPSADPTDPVSRDIIEDGCPVRNDTKVYTPPRDGLQPFSFEAFSFSQGVSLIYVHCDIIICHQSEESSCSTECNHSRRSRETRSTRDSGSGPYTVSQGPFIYKMAASGHGDGTPMNTILLSALVCTTVLLLASIVIGVFIYARFRKGIGRN